MANSVPTLTGLTTPVTFLENTVNAAPQIIDADVTFTDPDNNFDGGTLTVAGLLAQDTVAIRNQGTGTGEIGVSGSNVSFGGILIGSFAGGAGSTLTVTFNAAATAAGIEALIENLTYANSSDAPAASRSLELKVTDAAGFAAIAPPLAEQTGAANPFNGVHVGVVSTPSFADLDGDGDLDAVVGENDGILHYFENTGSATAPAFTEQTGAANPFDGVDVGIASAPSFADLDGDGDLDAVVGEFYGTLRYFENTGSATAPVFTARTGAANPFNGVDVGVYSTPASPTSTATATSTPSSGKTPAPCTTSRTPARPSRRPSPSAPAPPIRSTASMWEQHAPASPTSTATATSTPSSGSASAPCTISRTPERPLRRPSSRARRRQSVQRRRCGELQQAQLRRPRRRRRARRRRRGIRRQPALFPQHDAAGAGFRRADRRRQSVQRRRCRGTSARRASPTSTATATSTPSSGNKTGDLNYFRNTGAGFYTWWWT